MILATFDDGDNSRHVYDISLLVNDQSVLANDSLRNFEL